MSVTDSPSNQVETEPPKAVTRRWQLIIVTVGFVLPLIVIAIFAGLSEPSSGRAPQILLSDRPVVRPSMFAVVCYVLVSFALLDWPFFVLAARVKPTFRKYWPDAKAAHEAIIRGLIGTSIPFVFFYACAGVTRGGEAMAVFLPIVWLIAGWSARVGGRRVVGRSEVQSQRVDHGDRRPHWPPPGLHFDQ